MALLEVENLSIRFAGKTAAEDVHAVRGLSFSLEKGQCVAIVGESGSGKSATARALVGLAGENALVEADQLSLGQMDLRGLRPQQWRSVRGKHIGFILQDALVSLDPLKTIGAEVGETLREHRLAPAGGIGPRVVELLGSVGIADPEARVKQYAHQLSGGLRQRALIASAISGAPDILIADEPTTALDVIVQAQIIDLLKTMKVQGKGMILISHDLAVVAKLADTIIVLKDGSVMESGTPDAIFFSPKADYTKALLAAIPSAKTRGKALTAGSAGDAIAAKAERVEDAAPVLEARDLTKAFGQRAVVKGVSLSVKAGETVGLVGASGSGKTTLARLLLGLERPDSGSVLLGGRPWSDLPERRRRALRPKVQLVSQDPLGAFDPRYRVADILGEALEIAGVGRARRTERATELLNSVGLEGRHLNRRPRQLSGGQRQRIAIARALAMEPDILICDEPVSALDVSTQAQVLDLLDRLKKEFALTMLFVSHDLGVIHHVSDRVIVLNEGRVVEEGHVDTVFHAPTDPYTRALLDALPRIPERDAA